MSELSNLVQVALLGTQRESLPDFAQDTPLVRFIDQLQGADSASDLLSMAGAITLYEQVGQLPQRIVSAPRVRQTIQETLPGCHIRASRRLTTIFDTRHQDLLSEFLTALAQAKQRIPEEHLPNLLERGARVSNIRPLILPVLGETGRWLAAQNPSWVYASPNVEVWSGLIKQWRQGSSSIKQSLLHQLRHMNPERGRQLLESTWRAESSSNRSLFVKGLKIGLSMADEPFLEAALDDRSHTVRRRAAELLACLPPSRLGQRMIVNAAGLLKWTPTREHQITVYFPTEIKAQLVHDGVSLPKIKNLSRVRSTQMIDMVGAIPLSHWTDAWQVSADQIIRAALTSRWPRTLTRGFTLAAERQRNVEWALALLAHDDYSVNTIRLVTILPTDVFRSLMEKMTTLADPLVKDSLLIKILRKWPHPWNEDIAKIWLNHIGPYIAHHQKSSSPDPALRATFKQFARLCPPSLTDEVTQTLLSVTEENAAWRSLIQTFVSTLTFRREMLADIFMEECGNLLQNNENEKQ